MKRLLVLLVGTSMYAGDLIYLSDDITAKNLEILTVKYQQPLIIGASGAYLVPTDCKSERYFGGASDGVLSLTKKPITTDIVLNTQEVFEAKNENQIIKKIELEKTFAIAEGKISKDFLEDKEGRGFGGASESVLVIDNKINQVESMSSSKTQGRQNIHPSCEITVDGSGYKIDSLDNGQIYINGKIIPLHNNTVSFQ